MCPPVRVERRAWTARRADRDGPPVAIDRERCRRPQPVHEALIGAVALGLPQVARGQIGRLLRIVAPRRLEIVGPRHRDDRRPVAVSLPLLRKEAHAARNQHDETEKSERVSCLSHSDHHINLKMRLRWPGSTDTHEDASWVPAKRCDRAIGAQLR
jgi:hypothetical protein